MRSGVQFSNAAGGSNLKCRFQQETSEAAHAQWRVVADHFRTNYPKLAAFLDDAESDVLAFADFPRAHRKQIASTNPLERLNAEIKRRTDVVGIFPNDAAIVRLGGALLLEQNDEWQLQRRYLSLEGLGAISDTKTNGSQPSLRAEKQPASKATRIPLRGTRSTSGVTRTKKPSQCLAKKLHYEDQSDNSFTWAPVYTSREALLKTQKRHFDSYHCRG